MNCDERCSIYAEIQEVPKMCNACDEGKCGKTCGTFRRIEQLRKICLSCNACKDTNTLQIKGRGTVYLDSADNPELVIQHGTGKTSHAPEVYEIEEEEIRKGEGVTLLPPEAEAKFAAILRGLISLSPIQVLLCHHFANGGNLTNFPKSLEKVAVQIMGYKHLDKRNAWAIWKSVRLRYPELDVLFVRGQATNTIKKREPPPER